MRNLSLFALWLSSAVLGLHAQEAVPGSTAAGQTAQMEAEEARRQHEAAMREWTERMRSDRPASPMDGSRRPAGDVETNSADAGTNGDVFMTSPAPFTNAGVVLQAQPSWPFVVAKTGTSDTTSGFTVFNSSNTELMRVRSNGDVGIGVTAPEAKLHVFGTELRLENRPVDATSGSVTFISLVNRSASGGSYIWRFATSSSNGGAGVVPNALELYEYPGDPARVCCIQRMVIRRASASSPAKLLVIGETGNLGVGVWWPSYALEIAGSGGFSVDARVTGRIQTGDAANAGGVYLNLAGTEFVGQYSGDPDHFGFFGSAGTGVWPLLINRQTGNVSIGNVLPDNNRLRVAGNLHATGNISADGTIFAKYQDVAEWVPSIGDVPPGTVVVVATGQTNVVTPSTEPYDTRVAGVASAEPGLLLGQSGDTKVKIATTGRVRVKADATTGAIRAGDILVTSERAGMAMKSEPIDVGGFKLHRPGTIIGKALEPLEDGTGEILVLLSLQ